MKKKATEIPSHHLSSDGSRDFVAIKGNRSTLISGELETLNIFSPFQSDFFAIIMVHRGVITLKVNMQSCVLSKNQLLTFSPNMIKSLVSISADCRFTAILFKPTYLLQFNSIKHQELFDLFTQTLLVTTAPEEEARSLNKLLEVILYRYYQVATDFSNNDQIVLHSFFAFIYEFAWLKQRHHNNSKHKLTRKEDLLLRFTRLVAQECKQHRAVNFYAKKLFITPKYLSETAKEITGKTASGLIGELVVQEAMNHLSIPSLSVMEVTSLFSFPDISSFGKYFKRYTGVNPSSYRKRAVATN